MIQPRVPAVRMTEKSRLRSASVVPGRCRWWKAMELVIPSVGANTSDQISIQRARPEAWGYGQIPMLPMFVW